MNCDHHAGNGITACAMSCSHESASSLTTAVIFVLPAPAAVSQPAEAMATPANLAPTEFAHLFEPPSPPPRASLFSL
jgi:hypothetical protein